MNALASPPAAQSVPWRRKLRQRLMRWYDRHARDLPWRESRDPYRVWVSEIMLQQTQVATVKSYYPRFIEQFPSIARLAASSEADVLLAWEGLGYYRRARQMHRAAQQIVEQHAGQFPDDPAEVRALHGIGRYTAGAILSIAFGQREPILEANTVRLYSRLLGYRSDPRGTAGQRHLWDAAGDWLPRTRVGDFNQALMELGSEVCTVRQPNCRACPLAGLCVAQAKGLQADIPVPARRPSIQSIDEAAVVIRRRGGRVLIRQCGDDERWAGMWDFPRFAVESEAEEPLRHEVQRHVAKSLNLEIERPRQIAVIRHSVTRYRITLHCLEARLVGRAPRSDNQGPRKWVSIEDLEQMPLSVTGRKIGRMLQQGCRP
jgi:A/G-specific adenine glycosylase